MGYPERNTERMTGENALGSGRSIFATDVRALIDCPEHSVPIGLSAGDAVDAAPLKGAA